MSESTDFVVDLTETTTLSTKVKAMVSGKGIDVKREIELVAEFELIDPDDFDEIIREEGKKAAILRVLKSISGIKSADPNVTPEKAACAHPQICDALFGTYVVKNNENSRDIVSNAAQRGNSKRSRARS